MNVENTEIELLEFMDLIDFSLSTNFIEKWKFKYSAKFLQKFQLKLLEALSKRKQIRLDSLYTFFASKQRYNPDQVINFFESIEIELYSPLIHGNPTKFKYPA